MTIHCPGCDQIKEHRAKGLCASCYNKRYRRKYAERVKAYQQHWRRTHPGYMAKYMREYRAL